MLNKKEILDLLQTRNEQALFKRADEVRFENVGDEVQLRGLIEFSNICRNNCLYCGIRKGNSKVIRYRMSEKELLEMAQKAIDMGFKTIVLQSGEDMYYDTSRMCYIIEEIKKSDIALTLSIGERSYDDYKAFRNAGADRYLMRIETTDKDLYHRLDPNMDWNRRHECLMMIKELGFELGSGIMVGLPNQSMESIADDLLYLKQIGIDMAGIGPFIPHPETPLIKEKMRIRSNEQESVKTINAKIKAIIIIPICANAKTAFLLNLSKIAPLKSVKSKAGANCKVATRLTLKGSFVIISVSHGSAMTCIHEPIKDKFIPTQ